MPRRYEYFNEKQLELAIRAANDLVKSQIWISLPCKIVSYNAQQQTCVVQPLVQGKYQQPDGSWADGDYPQVRGVPVQFPSGGGWSITLPLQPGDEGTVEFQSRCIDNWHMQPSHAQPSSTGAWPQAEMRMHNWDDAYFKPGGRSKPRWLQNVSTTTMQLRSDDGKSYIELGAGATLADGAGGGVVNIVAPGGLTITAPWIEIVAGGSGTGEVRAHGEVTAKYGSGASVTQTGHRHRQDPDSHGDTEQDVHPATPGT